jgi:Family of unknown function (DUF6624)
MACLLPATLLAFVAAAQPPAAPPRGPILAAEIERLIDVALVKGTADDATWQSVRDIYQQDALPTASLVGETAAEDFVVLASAREQPIDFMQTVLTALERAPEQSASLRRSTLYLRARLRQRQREGDVGHAVTAPELRDRIKRLVADDQAVRQREGFDPSKMAEVDAKTAPELRDIITRYGVPDPAMVGWDAVNDFVILVQHQAPEVRALVLPKLKVLVDRGDADPADYAMMFDRAQNDTGKPQRYGMNFTCSGQHLAPAPIEDPERVEDRRAEVGLLPMRLYAKLLMANMPQDFCEKLAPASPK